MFRFIIFALMAAGMACALPAQIRNGNDKEGTYTRPPAPAPLPELSDLPGDLFLGRSVSILSAVASEILADAMGLGPQVLTEFPADTLAPTTMTASFTTGHGPVMPVARRQDVGHDISLADKHVSRTTATHTIYAANWVPTTHTVKVTVTPPPPSTSTSTTLSVSVIDVPTIIETTEIVEATAMPSSSSTSASTSVRIVDVTHTFAVTETIDVTATPSSSSTSSSTSMWIVDVTQTFAVTETIDVTVTPSISTIDVTNTDKVTRTVSLTVVPSSSIPSPSLSTVDVTNTAKVTRTVTPTEVPSSNIPAPSQSPVNIFPTSDSPGTTDAPQPTPAPEPTPTTIVITQPPEVITIPEIYVPGGWSAAHHIPICDGQYPDADCCPGHHPDIDCPVHSTLLKRAAVNHATATSFHVPGPSRLPDLGGGEFPRVLGYAPVPVSVASTGFTGVHAPRRTGPAVLEPLPSHRPAEEERWLDGVDECVKNPLALYCIAQPPKVGHDVQGTAPTGVLAAEERWLDGVDECVKNPMALYCIAQPPKVGHDFQGTAPTDVPAAEERDVAGPGPSVSFDPVFHLSTFPRPTSPPPPRPTDAPLVEGRQFVEPWPAADSSHRYLPVITLPTTVGVELPDSSPTGAPLSLH
ncbi:MAG: hypothetical protein Q9208_003127 [Pyrenodesmia sp. 3 TL-2023]